MNGLLLHSFKRYFGVKGYKTKDDDHTKIFTHKPYAKACYKGKGYYASFFSADQIPLYVSMQSGNATPQSDLVEVLRQGFQVIQEAGLSFEILRADGACYGEDVIRTVLTRTPYYVVRSQKPQLRQSA